MTSIVAGAPGTGWPKVKLALLRALRTFLQGVLGAFGSGAAGAAILTTGYWATFWVACLAALIAALVTFLHNVISWLPADT